MILFSSEIFVVLLLWLRHLLVTLLTAIVFKIRNILGKAGFKMCQAAHVDLVGTESMVGTETLRGPRALEL